MNDLYQEYPNFIFIETQAGGLLLSHEVIIFQHPFYWYSCPALLKQWQDQYLQYGFAHGAQGTRLKENGP